MMVECIGRYAALLTVCAGELPRGPEVIRRAAERRLESGTSVGTAVLTFYPHVCESHASCGAAVSLQLKDFNARYTDSESTICTQECAALSTRPQGERELISLLKLARV